MKLHDMRKKKIIQDPDGGWMSFHALKRIHHGLTAVLFGKGAKTVECNYRYLKSARELAVKYILKICSPVIHLHDICPESYLKSSFEIKFVGFVPSAELKVSAQQEDAMTSSRADSEHSWAHFLFGSTERWTYLIRSAEVNILLLSS